MNCFCIVPFTISTRPENICKILPETQSEKCLHNLGPPRLAYISGRSNKMCPGPGITLGLIIQNCHKAIATKKRMIYLPTFFLELLARCRLLQSLVSTAVLQRPIMGLWSDTIHHMGHQEASCSGGTGSPDIWQCHSSFSWSLPLQTIFTRSASTQFKPNQDHGISRCAIKVLSLYLWFLWERHPMQRRETINNVSQFFKLGSKIII